MQGYKTLIVAGAAACAGVLGWLTGTIPGTEMFMGLWGLLLVVFARMGLDIQIGGFLTGYKTYITAAIGMVTAVGSWASGTLTLEQLVTALVMGFVGIFFRAGEKKAVKAI